MPHARHRCTESTNLRRKPILWDGQSWRQPPSGGFSTPTFTLPALHRRSTEPRPQGAISSPASDTLLCEYVFMRTTIDLPDILFRKTKATAALRGSSMKDLIVRAIEREVGDSGPSKKSVPRRVKLPLLHLKSGRKLDLTKFDFDDLLA
jgi:hypothetical protein